MKRFLPVLFALLFIPGTMFAQAGKVDETSLLKSFGLNDSQISQVMEIHKTAYEAVRTDFTHIRLVKAQIAEALLPASPDEQAINALIEKKGQLRTDIEKTLMAARIKLTQILGDENAAKYARFIMEQRRLPSRRWGMPGMREESGSPSRPMMGDGPAQE